MGKLIDPIIVSGILFLLSPLIGEGAAWVVRYYNLPHILGFYIVIIPFLVAIGYLYYWGTKNV